MSKLDQIRALRERQYEESKPVAPKPVSRPATNSVTNRQSVTNKSPVTTGRSASTDDKARVARWRARNPDRYRDYMRDLMRKKRSYANSGQSER